MLSKRQGSTLSRRSILKSYHAHSGPTALQLPGVPNLRMARGLPVFTVGSISVQGMRRWGTVTVRGVFLSAVSWRVPRAYSLLYKSVLGGLALC